MKNSKSILALLVLLVSSTMVYSQNFSRLVREKGLVMQRIHTPGQTPGIGIMDFHSDGDSDHPDFIYLRAAAESDSLNPNNMVLTDSGLLAIGQNNDCMELTIPDFGDNDIMLYVNGDIATNTGNAMNIIASDERLKQNIHPLTNSLEVIRRSNFVEFQYNNLSGRRTDKTYYGIVAQEMQQVLPSTITQSVGRLRASDKQATEFLMFNPNDLIYSGLNAIKELDQENQDLKNKVAESAEKIVELEEKAAQTEALEARVGQLEQLLTELINQGKDAPLSMRATSLTGASLSQNAPNPLHELTDIEYILPKKYTAAMLVIQDMNGQQIAQFDLNETTGKITFRPKNYGISTGTYVYSLVIDGNIADSKKMIFFE